MPTQDDIATQIRQALQVVEPTLDTSIGTTVRKIIDVISEPIAEAYLQNFIGSYVYDIDTKSGADLDNFVNTFGFSRYSAKRATGVVTFAVATPLTQNILIPAGTQVGTNTAPAVVFSTIVPALLAAGQATIDVPVQAVLGGSAGNVGPNAINRRVTPLNGISTLSNTLATTGGADAEGDAALRARFKATVFRSLAGTEQMFLGIALDNPAVTQANVVGSSKTHRESIQIVGGTATSTVQNAIYVYDDPTLGPNIDGGNILGENVHYTFNPNVLPPTVTSIDSVNCPDGVYDLEFDYVPMASRNNPTGGITNKIDIYVNGTDTQTAVEQLLFSTANTFNTTANDPLNVNSFQRPNAAHPVAGNYFIRFTFAPVTSIPTITIGSTTYVEGTDYFLVNDITANGGTPYSLSGVEWISAANGAPHAVPTAGTAFNATYEYNAVPREVQNTLVQWRLVSTDVRVHQAKSMFLNIFIAVILSPGFSIAAVQTPVYNAISAYISSVSFDGVVQVSDLLRQIAIVPGIDAVRMLTSADDATNFGIQQVASDGATILANFNNNGTPKRANDVYINDDTLPVLNNVHISLKAQNTFGTE